MKTPCKAYLHIFCHHNFWRNDTNICPLILFWKRINQKLTKLKRWKKWNFGGKSRKKDTYTRPSRLSKCLHACVSVIFGGCVHDGVQSKASIVCVTFMKLLTLEIDRKKRFHEVECMKGLRWVKVRLSFGSKNFNTTESLFT